MKLLQKFNRQYISYAIAVLALAGTSIFLVVKMIVNEDTDEMLSHFAEQIESFEQQNPQELHLYPVIEVKFTESEAIGQYFSDTVLLVGDEFEEYRQLVVHTNLPGVKCKITVREYGIESRDLLRTLAFVLPASFAVLLLVLFLINKRISGNIWGPFFENLARLKQFSLQSSKPYVPVESDTEEFHQMNVVLKSLTDKLILDYDHLKRFSENASHELQTPLAVIRSKAEALLDEKTMTEMQLEKIKTIYQTVNRLSKINSGLLLLTKIENRQFADKQHISMDAEIKSHLESFSELIEAKQYEVSYHFHSDWIMLANHALLELLLNNLFANAILHNQARGKIVIELFEKEFVIANSGESPISDDQRLFERFFKGKESGSTGLGLAISKQICVSFAWEISYVFKNNMHVFALRA